MGERDAELLAQIAAYAGAINRHKQQHRSHATLAQYTKHTPYDRQSAHKERVSSSRHRTLVLSGASPADTRDPSTASARWISSRDRGHMTLTNASAYDQATASKLSRINQSREAKRKAILLRREAKEAERLKALASTTLTHNGIEYRFNKKANLLVRVNANNVVDIPTPLRTLIHGVEFLKSPKSNNLFRKTTIKLIKNDRSNKKGSRKFCKFYTRTGICTKAKDCAYLHDRNHVAVCPHFLSSHGCDASRLCNLSHQPSPHNAPTCTHFSNGICTKTDCKYAHISVSPSAPVCPQFARNGFCDAGKNCGMRHARECPQFSNTGSCSLKGCKLPHIARAGASNSQTFTDSCDDPSIEEDTDSASDCGTDEYDSEDFDENAFGEFVKL